MKYETTLLVILLSVSALTATDATAQSSMDCGSLENPYGPYDYTNGEHRVKYMPIVVGAHFNRDVQTLRKGQSTADPLGDLDYTLRAFPNHHPALDAVSRYFLQGGRATGALYTAECYFDRAMRFKPDDGIVYLLYGTYLHRKKDLDAAARQYDRALGLLDDSPDAYYNYALLKADQGRWSEARKFAIEAYSLNHPLQGLKRKLQRNNAWSAADDEAVRVAIKARREAAAVPVAPAVTEKSAAEVPSTS
ncbi:MAG TPA: hypothetical protein P5528_10385 [Steroidobacteraceae bacterium]|nr:hypothetical protein [Steroidobacteraceae bacterium]HRX89840.1 hypothetical protein [Steroidobacteraceae bacterium]